ncbi:uncharacterized protein LOC126565997 [Anopheles maculipalpis]|uniref:uncharacterized protein LOC126565997 n=1 Tax=Anopheles maculipalpis TaxID=1496333 RepID=UPI0021597779|nr:uncharacterized protein LOC126565997 [Anopheles maculipalpis]
MNVSALTDIALQIMGYKMYDRNGVPIDTLDEMIVKYQANKDDHQPPPTAKAKGMKRKSSNTPVGSQEHFFYQFGLPSFDTLLDSPKQYVEMQMVTFVQQQQDRLIVLRTEDDSANKPSLKAIRTAIGKKVAKEKPMMMAKMNKIFNAMNKADEVELLSRTQFDLEVGEHILLKQGLLLREFNTLLQLLKRIMEDLAGNYEQFDFAFYLVQKLYEQIKTPNDQA